VNRGTCFRIFDVMATGGMKTGATMGRAIKHLADTSDFWNIRSTRLIPILSYLREITARLPHWQPYQDHLEALQLAVEHWKG